MGGKTTMKNLILPKLQERVITTKINKSWVIVRCTNHPENMKKNCQNKIEIWRDYDGHAWGSALYEVLDYFDGSYIQAKQHSLTL